MATSGSLSTSKYSGRYYTLSWTATQSAEKNQSTISWTLKAVGGTSAWFAERTLKVVIAGTTVFSKTDRVERYEGTVKTGTIVLTHNTDGTKSFSASVEAAVYTSSVNCTGSATFTLTAIPRASSVSATNANIGSVSTITISRASSSFTHTLTYSFGSLTGTVISNTSNTSISWTVPTTFYAQMPNETSKTGTITCTTYNGSTSIGSSTCNFVATTKSDNCKPVLSPTVTDSNSVTTALTGDNSKFIKYYSNAAFNIRASAQNSATIKSQKVTCNNKSSTNASGTLSSIESATFSFSATDSRGYTTTQTVNKTLINYIKLTCNLSASMSVDGKVAFTVSGNYYNGSFGKSSNTLTVKYRYKIVGESYGSWVSLTAQKSGNTYTVSSNITGLDYLKNYTVQVQAIDALATVYSSEKTVNCVPVFDWSGEDFNFNVPVTIKGNALSDYVIEHGSNGEWAYRKWASGLLEVWRATNTATNVSIESSYGNRKYAAVTLSTTGDASQFKTIEDISASGICNVGLLTYSIYNVAISNGVVTTKVWIGNDSALSNQDIYIKLRITGRWK